MMHVRWHTDDQTEWFGWTADQDMREDAPVYSVRSPEPGVWAGWRIYPDGSQECVTMDHETPSSARMEVEDGQEG